MKALDIYFAARELVLEHFGFVETWHDYPLDDCRESFWALDESLGKVRFADDTESLADDSKYCEHEVTSPGRQGGVFVAGDYTMVAVDTHCDGNRFLSIFSNEKRVKWDDAWDGDDEDMVHCTDCGASEPNFHRCPGRPGEE